MQIQEIFSIYKEDLQQVEKCISDNAISEIKLIPEVAHHLIDSGGKRFRPLLLLIASRLCGYHGEHRYAMGTVMEYIQRQHSCMTMSLISPDQTRQNVRQ